jgi:sterol desaturase/sphingolipid hydroxylase (fatty acid hydroxylase superfamily)
MYQQLTTFAIDLLRQCAWLVLLMIVFVPLERLFKLHSQNVFRKSFGSDLIYWFLNGILPKIVLILPLTVLSAGFHHFVPIAFYHSVAALPLWLRMSAAMVVGEIGAYWGHRWSHEIPFLWRFHAIHHSAEEIDWLVSSRVHPVDHYFTRFCMLVPMYLLGLAQPMSNRVDMVSVLVTVIGTYWGFFIHANVNWRFGWLEWLVATPAFHHWHHTNDGPQVIDKNYASTLPWLDKLFGTFYLPANAWPEKYGTDTPVSAHLSGQLFDPLTQPAAPAVLSRPVGTV